jgi:hypothetical protein
MGRAMAFNQAMWTTEASIGRILNGTAKKVDIKWMDDFIGRDKWEPLLLRDDKLPPEIVKEAAARYVESVQGTYTGQGLPSWVLHGPFAPMFSLMKWNIEKMNNFGRYALNPLFKHKDPGPILKMALGAVITGEGLLAIRELITGRKPQEAEWNEIVAAGGEGLPYRLLASATYTGYAGTMLDTMKQATDITRGRESHGVRMPLMGAAQSFADRGKQMARALDAGENPLEVLVSFITSIGKDNVQMIRALARLASSEEAANVEKANALRDVRTFRELNDIPQSPMANIKSNPMLNPLKRKFQRSTNPQEVMNLAPQLINQAFERSQGDPSRLSKMLSNYRAAAGETMPSPKTQGPQFLQYLQWLERTQGPEAAQKALSDYQQKQALDEMRRKIIPTIKPPSINF